MSFSVFMQMCMDNMRIFKIENKKKERAFVAAAIVLLIVTETLAIIYPFYFAGPSSLFLVPGAVPAGMAASFVLMVVLLKSVARGFVFTVYLSGFIVGMMSAAMMVLTLMGREIDFERVVPLIPYGAVAYAVFAVSALLSILVKRFLKKRVDLNFMNSRAIHLVLIASGIVLVFIYINFITETAPVAIGRWAVNLGDIAYVLFFVSSVITFAVILRYISKESALKTEKLLIDASQSYIRGLEESYKALRTIKHDYVNILSSFKLYIDGEDMAGLRRYYYNELSEINRELLHQDKLLGSLQNVQVSEVKSVLIYKLSNAAGRGINVAIEATSPVERLGVSTAICCQMLGILLDNAIEAAEEADEKKINIAIVKNPGSAVFIIQNTWMKRDIPADKLFELGFSTKAEGRGIGLSTARGYTDKVKGLYLETEMTDEYFTQRLTVKRLEA